MDRFDLLELLGILLLIAFAFCLFHPAALAVAGVAALVEAQLRSLTPVGQLADVEGEDHA